MTKLQTCKKDPMFPAGLRFRQFSVPGKSPFPTVLPFRQFSVPGMSPFPAVLLSRQVSISGSSPFPAGLRFRQFSVHGMSSFPTVLRQVSSISGGPTGGTCNKTTTHSLHYTTQCPSARCSRSAWGWRRRPPAPGRRCAPRWRWG